MTDKIRALPNKEADEVQAAFDLLERMMPKQAAMAKIMMKEFEAAGFKHDDALKLVAYAIFK